MSQEATKEPSEEADERQLDLARAEGDAFQQSLRHMVEDVAQTGGSRVVGDVQVGFAIEEAEGLYQPRGDGDLEWAEPADEENCHLEVVVSDAADGRFVPELDVTATLDPEDGEAVGPFEVPYVWHPGLHHYGTNLSIPGDGTYDVRVHVDPPSFHRHDETNGDRYAESVDVEFEGVDVEAGSE